MVTLTYRKPKDWTIYFATAKDAASPVILRQGLNKIENEQWDKIKNHPDVKAAMAADDLVKGVDASAATAEQAKQLTKPITDIPSREARDIIPSVTDKATLQQWARQEGDAKSPRDEVMAAILGQLKLVAPEG